VHAAAVQYRSSQLNWLTRTLKRACKVVAFELALEAEATTAAA
jgi:hypothetical protein